MLVSFFLGDSCHQILPKAHKLEFKEKKIGWRKSPKKNDKVYFSVLFDKQIIFHIKAKLIVKKFV